MEDLLSMWWLWLCWCLRRATVYVAFVRAQTSNSIKGIFISCNQFSYSDFLYAIVIPLKRHNCVCWVQKWDNTIDERVRWNRCAEWDWIRIGKSVFYIVNWNSNRVSLKSFHSVFSLRFVLSRFVLAGDLVLSRCVFSSRVEFTFYQPFSQNTLSRLFKMSAVRLMRKCYSSEKPTKTWTEEMWLGFVVSCKRLPFDFVFDDQMMIWFYAKFNYRMFIKTISSSSLSYCRNRLWPPSHSVIVHLFVIFQLLLAAVHLLQQS